MTSEERERREREAFERRERMGMPIRKEVFDEYEQRVQRHLTQEPSDFFYEGVESEMPGNGNMRLFGNLEEKMPPVRGGAWKIETPFSIFASEDHGKIREKRVMIRVWNDVPLDRSIDLNVRMVYSVTQDKIKRDTIIEITVLTVIMWLRLRGQFFWFMRDKSVDTKDPDESLFFDGKDRKLYRIASKDFKTWFHAHSGISPANERVWKQVMEGVKTVSTNPQIAKGVKPGVLFDRRGDVLYISNGASSMARIDKDGVKIVSNGTDGVVFALGKTLAPWELLAEKEGKNPFEASQVFGNANYASKHGRTILALWFVTLAACIKNYPIILFQGRYRSGKTRCAQAVFELLGVPASMNSVQDNGQEDFWALLNTGGVICFDNVDGRIVKWFPNDIQIASTGGSKTKRKMYTDSETVQLGANAKIMLTANDPKFMSDSGISDRVLNIELLPFTAANGKVSEDSKLTEDITAMRSAAFTWMAYTLSRALGDTAETRGNINKRHPDFARFAIKVSRALGIEDEGINALVYAEFNKSFQTVITDRVTQMVFEVIRGKLGNLKAGDVYEFSSSEMLAEIKAKFADQIDDFDKQLSNRVIGKVMNKHLDELRAMFETNPPRTLKGITRYGFKGFTESYVKMLKEIDGGDDVSANSVEDDGGVNDDPPQF